MQLVVRRRRFHHHSVMELGKWAIFHSAYSGDVFIPLMALVKMTFTG